MRVLLRALARRTVEHIDVEQLAGRDDLMRDQHVLGAWCG
jgi:hypothetical protein